MSEPVPTPKLEKLRRVMGFQYPHEVNSPASLMQQDAYGQLEAECTRLRTALKSCLSAWIRTGLSSADFDLYKESKAILAELDSQQKQP